MNQSERPGSTGRSDKYPELLRDFCDKAAPLLTCFGLTPELAEEAAFKLAELIRENWGGVQVYIPQALYFDLNERDHEIYREYSFISS